MTVKYDTVLGDLRESDEYTGAGGIVDITYENLLTAIGASGLVSGQLYRITDYAIVLWMVDGDDSYILEEEAKIVHTGEAEPLVVLATSANTLSQDAYSATYPEDTIKYDWDITNWESLKPFYDGDTSETVTGFKGVIYRREDNINNNRCNFDFREITYRLWSIEQASWVAQAYNEGDFVQHSGDDNIYVALQAVADTAQVEIVTLTGTSGTANITGAGGLTKLVTFGDDLPDTAADFVTSWAADYLAVGIVITNNGETIVFTANVAGTGFTQPAIANASGDLAGTVANSVLNFAVTEAPDTRADYWKLLITLSDFDSAYLSFSSTGLGVGDYTIPVLDTDDYFDRKMFGDSCTNNLFDEYFVSLPYTIFGSSCDSNTFGTGCGGNTFGTDCSYNTFGADCDGNTFGTSCSYNTFGAVCQSNTFGTGCGGNTFGSYCAYNTFGSGCSVNTFGTGCGGNTFGTDCDGNTFGTSCFNNTLPDSSYLNEFKNDVSSLDCSAFDTVEDTNVTHQISNGGNVYQTYIDDDSTPTLVITTETIGISS